MMVMMSMVMMSMAMIAAFNLRGLLDTFRGLIMDILA